MFQLPASLIIVSSIPAKEVSQFMNRKLRLSLLAFATVLLFQCAAVKANVASGPITLNVDATEAPRKIFHARMTIPVSPGPLTLVYPKWIPGEHGPTGPIINLAGLRFMAGGQTIPWRRDDVEMYAFHLDVPTGVNSLEASLDFLSPTFAGGFTAGASTTSHLAIVTWNQLVLYPDGANISDVNFKANLSLPAGWKFGTSLPVTNQSANKISFDSVSLERLVDSPVLAGEYFLVIPLAANPANEIDIAADNPADLQVSPELTMSLKRVVSEAVTLFGATHYTHYHFLLTLSDHTAHFGLEHHESNDSRVAERALVDDVYRAVSLSVLPHEFVHSWNGKYRRPAGLATPNYQEPMKGELLWVYEGLTEYLGNLLAARSGLWTPQQYRDALAQVAADLDHKPGRMTRPLIDTTVAAQLLYNAPEEWTSIRRSVDFYDEGWLIWLDVDTKIRELTNGAKSLDDFCKRFHGAPSTPPMVKTYTFDDVVATLNEVTPFDWRNFLQTRLDSTDFHAPLGGIERGGWKLGYQAKPSAYLSDVESVRHGVELGYSIGLRLHGDGLVGDVIEGSPASKAGIGPGMKVVAVDGKAYSAEILREAIKSATDPKQRRIDLLIDNEGHIENHQLTYGEGEKYPVLERDTSKPDTLSKIIAPLTWSR
jgi:predicted metalloprotease with PDZ domain